MRRAWLLLVLSGCELIVGTGGAEPLVLDRLTITPGTIDQQIDPDTIHYTATVPATDSVKISAHSPDDDVNVTIQSGIPIGNGAISQPVAVVDGDTVTVKLHASEANVDASFTITVNMEAP